MDQTAPAGGAGRGAQGMTPGTSGGAWASGQATAPDAAKINQVPRQNRIHGGEESAAAYNPLRQRLFERGQQAEYASQHSGRMAQEQLETRQLAARALDLAEKHPEVFELIEILHRLGAAR